MNDLDILVVAPHPDDETLGCGGTLLKFKEAGARVHWLIVTGMTEEAGYTRGEVTKRKSEIQKVADAYNFTTVNQLNFQPANLDVLPKKQIVSSMVEIMNKIQPNQVYTVYRNDAHSDHEAVYDAVIASIKSFRTPYIQSVYVYETLSETDFGLKPEDPGFKANVFVDIEKYLNKKIDIMNIYASELGDFPFPRSTEAVRALAMTRGVQCRSKAAEAFMLVKEIK